MSGIVWVMLCVFVMVFGIVVLTTLQMINMYLTAKRAGVRLSFLGLMSMKLRKIVPRSVIPNAVRLKKEGIDVTIKQLEDHYLAGGSPGTVANALIRARREQTELSYKTAAALDLARRIEPDGTIEGEIPDYDGMTDAWKEAKREEAEFFNCP